MPVFQLDRVAADYAAHIVDPGLEYHAINSGIPKDGVNAAMLKMCIRDR